MGIKPAIFQEDAANAVIEAFRGGSSKYLVADETGLGKTIIARTVIEKMAELAPKDAALVVYYFGSNLMLLDNTIGKLRKGKENIWVYHTSPKKLGMMAGELRPKSGVHIYGFSANLLGEGKSIGDGKTDGKGRKSEERPLYKAWRDDEISNKRYLFYAERLAEQEKITKNDLNAFDYLWNRYRKWSDREDITILRKLFELYTLENNPPDLIIFDELHRYDKKVVEFINLKVDWSKIKMLFLSATPYNYYPELNCSVAEDEGENEGGTIRSFVKLLEIMNADIIGFYEKYKTGELSPADFSSLLKKNCIYRNERLSDGTQKYHTLPTVDEFAGVFRECIYEERRLYEMKSARYWKLCSGAYSFPVKKYNKSNPDFYDDFCEPGIFYEGYFEDDDFIFDRRHKLKRNGFYWQNLRLACIKNYNAEEGRGLLWVPPTMPEYKLRGRFEQSAFSKLMIFSAYKMVPRIVSGVFSAYVSDDIGEVVNPIDLSEVDQRMEKIWGGELVGLAEYYDECRMKSAIEGEETDANTLIECLVKKIKECRKSMSEDDEILTAKYIIGSPYMCAARVFGKEHAEDIKKVFNRYFRKEGIKQAIRYCNLTDAEKLLDYCIDGGLGAVLKEYRFAGGEKQNIMGALMYGTEGVDLEGTYACSRVHVYSLDCYSDNSDCIPFKVPCHYAERFNEDYTDTGASETSSTAKEHFLNCHNAFNSPFWPMILCTTSANQEGYDLDRYCSRIMHYSLPASTMAFEQRDGRIDRRLSLLARRRMAQLYASPVMTWERVFSNDVGESGMSPYWTQMGYIDKCEERGLKPLKFERIVPYFPMTGEYILYRQLMERKNAYRGHFGLPNESECGIDAKEMQLKLNNI